AAPDSRIASGPYGAGVYCQYADMDEPAQPPPGQGQHDCANQPDDEPDTVPDGYVREMLRKRSLVRINPQRRARTERPGRHHDRPGGRGAGQPGGAAGAARTAWFVGADWGQVRATHGYHHVRPRRSGICTRVPPPGYERLPALARRPAAPVARCVLEPPGWRTPATATWPHTGHPGKRRCPRSPT